MLPARGEAVVKESELMLAIGEAKNAFDELGERLGFPRMPSFVTEGLPPR
jgi:hypothetical protein